MSGPDLSRHLSATTFEGFLAQGVPFNFVIEGSPPLTLFIHPAVPEIGIRAGVSGVPIGNRQIHRGVRSRTVHAGGQCDEVVVVDESNFKEGYALLCTIADRVQLDGFSLSDAVRSTSRNMSRLLASDMDLTREAELGLFGELCVLKGAVRSMGPTLAVGSWLGQAKEEHDFRTTDADLEVKTTASDRRRHRISSASQLEPSKNRQLWLVSIQLTAAPAGIGKTVGGLHEEVGLLFDGSDRDYFDEQIEKGGWTPAQLARSDRRWSARSDPRAFLVGDQFPRLTPSMLQSAGAMLARISEISYTIDLDGFISAQPGTQLDQILKGALNGL